MNASRHPRREHGNHKSPPRTGNADGVDLYFPAVCHRRLDDRYQAGDCYGRAVKWHEGHAATQSSQAAPNWRSSGPKWPPCSV
ncbi:MAG: hypothetical protein U0871_15135 [Gemmataceae bacterium]